MILIIFGRLQHYRKTVLNQMAVKEDVIVVHSGPSLRSDDDLFVEKVVKRRKFGPFIYQSCLNQIVKEVKPRAIIATFDLRYISSIILMFFSHRKLSWVWWGIDNSNNYFAQKVRLFILKLDNASVAYSQFVFDKLPCSVKKKKSIFIANNTIHMSTRLKCYEYEKENMFLNVGTLDFRKKNEFTIWALHNVAVKYKVTDFKMLFVGDGPAKSDLISLVKQLDLSKQVIFLGRIEDASILADLYKSSLASISPGQAGLSVLQSMSFGVPFITSHGAVTGGEIGNIIDKKNGLLLNLNVDDLSQAIINIFRDHGFAKYLGRNAYEHYERNCKVEDYAKVLRDATFYEKK